MTTRDSTTQPLIEETVVKIFNAYTVALKTEIENRKLKLESLTVGDTFYTSEQFQKMLDDKILCEEALDIVKSLPAFTGKKNSYMSWRMAAHNCAALAILRNKIINEANEILINHGKIFNFDAIISRLDFAYSDKKPIHLIDHDLSTMRQGNQSLIDFYNEVNKKLTLLINKTIMMYGTKNTLANELNNKYRQNALCAFIAGLNSPLNDILFFLSPADLPNALAKAQEIEAYYPFFLSNTVFQTQNMLNFPKKNGNQEIFNLYGLNQPGNMQGPEPMDVDE